MEGGELGVESGWWGTAVHVEFMELRQIGHQREANDEWRDVSRQPHPSTPMKRKLPFYFWFIAITVASLMPASALPGRVTLPLGADKGAHMLMYMILAMLARPVFMSARTEHRYRKSLLIMLGITLYGILLEILQPQLSTRSFEWTDILANTAGVLGGCLLWGPLPHLLTPPEASPTEYTEAIHHKEHKERERQPTHFLFSRSDPDNPRTN